MRKWEGGHGWGKNNVYSTIISAYRPQALGGDTSVKSQQLRYIREKGSLYDDPIQLFDDNLANLITEKQELGQGMILMGGFNVSLDVGFQEVIIEKYLQEGDTAPPTYKNHWYKIDGILATDDINILQGGHEDIDSLGGDHCWNWADITTDSLLGGQIDPFTKPISQKLNCKQVKVWENFQHILHSEYTWHNLVDKLEKLHTEGLAYYEEHGDIDPSFTMRYNTLQKLSEDAIKHADSKCKKTQTGRVTFLAKQEVTKEWSSYGKKFWDIKQRENKTTASSIDTHDNGLSQNPGNICQ